MKDQEKKVQEAQEEAMKPEFGLLIQSQEKGIRWSPDPSGKRVPTDLEIMGLLEQLRQILAGRAAAMETLRIMQHQAGATRAARSIVLPGELPH